MDLGLRGKSVLITGGSKGIGLACAVSFAAEGCNLHLASRNMELLQAAKRIVREHSPVEVALHAADLRNPDALKELAAACSAVDILVNNAGDIPAGDIETIDEAKWRYAWELKVFGYVNLTRAIFSSMKSRKSGVVINVIGMAAENPSFDYVCGATANAALAAFTKALGKGSQQFGIRVMGVHPPATRTDRIVQVMQARAKLKYGDENRTDDLIKDGLFVPPIDPEQVADAVVYLASPRASQLSGIMMNLGVVK